MPHTASAAHDPRNLPSDAAGDISSGVGLDGGLPTIIVAPFDASDLAPTGIIGGSAGDLFDPAAYVAWLSDHTLASNLIPAWPAFTATVAATNALAGVGGTTSELKGEAAAAPLPDAPPPASSEPAAAVVGGASAALASQSEAQPAAATGAVASSAAPAAAAAGGLTLNLIWDGSAFAAPQSFRDGVMQAAAILQSNFNDPITVNIEIGYGEFGNTQTGLTDTALGEAANGTNLSYATLRGLLASHATSGDDQISVGSLPGGSSLQGQSSFFIGSAQEKALGLIPGTSSGLDGTVGIGTRITGNELVSVALHEITHSMGRLVGASLDLFRYSSPGQHVFGGAIPARASYFSINGGATDLADFGRNSDPSDFLNGGVQDTRAATDPFDEFYSGQTPPWLTGLDLTEMDILGFQRASSLGANLIPIAPGAFDSSGRSGMALNNAGRVLLWMNVKGGFSEVPVPGAAIGAEWTAADTGDFNGDGNSDILWTRPAAGVQIWLLNGPNLVQAGVPSGQMGAEWHVAGVGDFTGDRKADILWGNTSGQVALWTMNGTALSNFAVSDGRMGSEWSIATTGDFNGDGKQDLAWVSNTGAVATWLMNGSNLVGFNSVGQMGTEWHIAGAADFTGDGVSDLVWLDSNNDVQLWTMSNGRIAQITTLNGRDGLEWHLDGIADFTGDGRADLLWISNTSAAQVWSVNGAQISVAAYATPGDVAPGATAAAAGAAPPAPAATTGFTDIALPAPAAAAPQNGGAASPGAGDSGGSATTLLPMAQLAVLAAPDLKAG